MFRLNGGRSSPSIRARLRRRGHPAGHRFSLGHIVATRDEVDALLAKAKAAGAPVTALHDRPWGSTPATSATATVTCGKSSTT